MSDAKQDEAPPADAVPYLPNLPDDELNAMFDSPADAFRIGYRIGTADQKGHAIKAFQSFTAYLQKELVDDLAFIKGEAPPLDH